MPACRWFTASGGTPVRAEFHVVGIDNVECGRMAARTLPGAATSDVAFLGGPGTCNLDAGPFRGFWKNWRGIRHAVRHSYAEGLFLRGRAARKCCAAQGPPAEAYFCGDDVLSIGALSAIAIPA
jgi:DNA-binding LacI/PurR family transcriptional regulator